MNTEKQWELKRSEDKRIDALYGFLKEEDRTDAFSQFLAFGTGGMRGLLGPGANRINHYTIARATLGFGKYLLEQQQTQPQRGVAIAYDNRHFSHDFALISAQVLASLGIESHVFKSLRPTPELSFAVRELGCIGGIMITASHNPKTYNGYKIYDETGCQLVPDKAKLVMARIDEVADELSVSLQAPPAAQALIHMIDDELDHRYLDRVAKIRLHPELDSLIRVVYTAQHGTGSYLMPALFEQCGITLIPVAEQCVPDPNFSQTANPNPEVRSAFDHALKLAKEVEPDLVLSSDPDADRMGIVVRHQGEYVFLTGNQGGAILQEYIYTQREAAHTMPEHPIMFNTIVTSDLGKKVAADHGVAVEQTLTGFKFIGEKIHEYELHPSKTFVFGYEESYGYLMADFVRDKDAFQACVMIADAANFYKHQGKTLVDVLDDLYARHGAYVEEQDNIVLSGLAGQKKIAGILDYFRTHKPTSLDRFAVNGWEDYLTQEGFRQGATVRISGLPKENVLKFYLDNGWLAIRPSGTEPKCKIYYCLYAQDEAACRVELEDLRKVMTNIIKPLIGD